MISQRNLYKIIARYLSGECTREEEKAIRTWLQEDPKRELIYNEVYDLWQKNPVKERNWDVRSEWEKLSHKLEVADEYPSRSNVPHMMTLTMSKSAISHPLTKPRIHRMGGLKYWFVRIAAIFLLIGLSSLLVNQLVLKTNNGSSQYAMREVATEAGQRANVQLEDGTHVILNSSSRLAIPDEFRGDQRSVHLTGEAYFKVVNEDRPFIVFVDNKQIEILGTEFNVRAYENEPFQVLVSDGVVAVHDPDLRETDRVVLHREEMLLNTNGVVDHIKNVNLDLHIAWIDNKLVFNDTTLDQVAGTLERWFRIKVEISDPELENLRISGTFKDEPAYEVIRILALGLDLDYEVEERRVLFMKKKSD